MKQCLNLKELSSKCLLCGGRIDSALGLQDLPVTGGYGDYNPDSLNWSIDQELMICSACGHGQLKNMIDMSFLYGGNCSFRTSASQTARSAAIFLVNYLDRLFPGRTFDRIVDFGCNDAYLLKQLKHKGDQLLGVDLIWQNRESDFEDEKIVVRGEDVENIDFQDVLGGIPNLILSQHTIEHLSDPKRLLESLYTMADDETIFLFEIPCFDLLLEHFRIDQIFHGHLHYFSQKSFMELLKRLGFYLIDVTFNLSHWGALLVVFKKATGHCTMPVESIRQYPKIVPSRIKSCYQNFQQQMSITREAIKEFESEGIWGYGAALMLPILGYHLKIDFSEFVSILDDDPLKHGTGYVNLPIKIQHPDHFDYAGANICLTAIDNRRSILRNLLSKQVKGIINPINFI